MGTLRRTLNRSVVNVQRVEQVIRSFCLAVEPGPPAAAAAEWEQESEKLEQIADPAKAWYASWRPTPDVFLSLVPF